jgi:hypothetical protein
MIALTKSGYEKFIQGTKNIFTSVKVAPLAEGITNANFTKAGVNAKRIEANTNAPEFDIDNFTVEYIGDQTGTVVDDQNNILKWKGQVEIDTKNFVSQDASGVTSIDQAAAVIDTADGDEPLGLIKLYPTGSPITYAALNSAPVNIDFRLTGMAQTKFKPKPSTTLQMVDGNGNAIITDFFPKSILKLPFFDSTTTCNLLTDLRIALLSASEDAENTFFTALYQDSKTMDGTIDTMNTDSKYHYISGGFKFENLGYDASFAALSADDTTLNITGLTINENKVFAVVYFETQNSVGLDVMSDAYKQNSYILTTVENVDAVNNPRFPFKQSVIINSMVPGSFSNNTFGILAMNNVIGPEFGNANRNLDIPNS